MQTKTGRDLKPINITAENYLVKKGEELCFHAKIEQVKFNPNTGARESKPRIQIFGMKEFSKAYPHLQKMGYTVEILHDPTIYKAENERKAAEAQAEKENAARLEAERVAAEKAEAERIQKEEEIEALKAKLKADLLKEIEAENEAKAEAEKKANAGANPAKK